ncbi:MAG: DUF222 domain-containing protein [Protaetiibacter sp.]
MPSITDSLTRLGDLSVPFAPAGPSSLADAELLALQGSIARVHRRLESLAASVAGEIAHRSRRELGSTLLAASNGQRTPEALISQLTGASTRDARPLVKAAELIRTRLAAADRADGLLQAATRLVAEAPGLKLEDLAARAAHTRDTLDTAGIAAREHALHRRRFLHITKQPDGMTRLSGLLDPESAAIVVPILDAATSPRRGGPRFVDPDARQRAEDLMRDERTTEQLALDVFVELIRMGSQVDPGRLLGDRKPTVRILVTKADLDTREGAAYFEGQHDAVSVSTAERFICSTGAVAIPFDGDGRVLDLGREQRLFSEKQRTAMAARDGGCLMCGRPPSWCEAHHIDPWHQHGRTDIDDGVLLCRFWHLKLHNNRWRVRRNRGDYFLERPHGERVPLPSRNPAHQRLLSRTG